MTICVTWQLRVTLDRIRNSCDVFLLLAKNYLKERKKMWERFSCTLHFFFSLGLKVVTGSRILKVFFHLPKSNQSRLPKQYQDFGARYSSPPSVLGAFIKKCAKIEKEVKYSPPTPLFRGEVLKSSSEML